MGRRPRPFQAPDLRLVIGSTTTDYGTTAIEGAASRPLILVSTLGGIALFGVSGFIVGPILTALFITLWEMFGVAFRDILQGRQTPASAS